MTDTSSVEIELLKKRLEKLEEVCGEAYQFAGQIDWCPVEVLDNLAAAMNKGEIPHESFLPVIPPSSEKTNVYRVISYFPGRKKPTITEGLTRKGANELHDVIVAQGGFVDTERLVETWQLVKRNGVDKDGQT